MYKLFGVWTSSQEPVGLFLLNLSPSRKLVVKKYFSNKNHWVDQIYSKEERYITNEDFTLGQRVWSQGHGHFKVDIVLKTYAKSWS